MVKNLKQFGFRLDHKDRDWFISECQKKELSAANVLGKYIKRCRELGTIDPLGIVNDANLDNKTEESDKKVDSCYQELKESLRLELEEVKKRLQALEDARL